MRYQECIDAKDEKDAKEKEHLSNTTVLLYIMLYCSLVYYIELLQLREVFEGEALKVLEGLTHLPSATSPLCSTSRESVGERGSLLSNASS